MSRYLINLFLIMVFCVGFFGIAYSNQNVTISDSPSGAALLNQDRDGLTFEVEIGSLDFTPISSKEGSFILLTVDGFSHSQKIGEPNLPLINRIISIPFGCELQAEVLEYEVEEISLSELNLTDPLIPVQPSLSKSQDPEDVPFEYHHEIYQQSGYYGLPIMESSLIGTMRSLYLGMISIAPVEYNPIENTIKVYKHIIIEVKYLHPNWAKTEEMYRDCYSPVFEPVYNRIFNYEPFTQIALDDLVKYPVKYIIISDTMFASQLQPFIEWKTKKGFEVVVGYTSSIGFSTTAIKNYIQNIYNTSTPKPSFVLLVGDTPQIPSFNGDAGGHVTDLRYCEFTGDDLPEIYYGRFSAQNTGELQPQIDKTLEYEQYTMPDPSYLAEVTMISGVDGTYAITHGNGQINYGTNLYFNTAHGITDHTWLYPDSDTPGASSAIIQTVDDGVGFMNYTAHCGHSGFGNPSFTTTDIGNLTNAHKYLLAIGNCCLSNTFDESTPCFGEAWLRAENKGGVGYIGGSNSTYWDEDYWWGVGAGPIVGSGPTYEQTGLGAYDGVFHDHGEPVTQHYITNDAVVFCGNLGVVEGGSSITQYYWEIYHLMGDPSVMNYMGVPSVNNVVHSGAVLMTATSLTVQADPGSYVGISFNGVLHGAAYVGVSGSVDVPLTPFGTVGDADIVVTCQNREPYISTISIFAPDGPYVIFDSYDINDASGNNNSELDAGESVFLGVQLENVGPDNAYSVTATLSSTDSYVIIADAIESYGTINGNSGTAYQADAFAFSVLSDVPDGHSIAFELSVSGTAADTWISNFSIPVHAPEVSIISVSINDASGNSNGIFDPGETVDIIVALENSGSGLAGSVVGILSESDSYVSVDDANGSFGDILENGGTADDSTDVFIASALSSCPMGHGMTFTINLSGALGYTSNVDFDVAIGDRSVVYYDDFSYDQGWTGLGGSAEWTMGPAVGGGDDPSQDHSPTGDNRVLGNDLTSGDGDYESSLGETYWATSSVIDCADYTSVIMTYYHWLGMESSSYDHAYFQVYNGSSWVTLYENGSTSFSETSWNEEYYDLSSYADENSSFRIRFGLGSTDGSVTYCGWNIDDIEIKGYYQGSAEPPDMSYNPSSLADSLVEGQSALHHIKVYNSGLGNLRVRFSSSDSWLEFDPSQFNVAPNDSLDFEVTVNAAGLPHGSYSGSLDFTSNDLYMLSGSIPVDLYVYPPDIYIGQSSIDENLETDEQSSIPLVITNNGSGRLYYSVDTEIFESLVLSTINNENPISLLSKDENKIEQEPLGYHPASEKSAKPEPFYPPMTLSQGGPDAFGYTWIDSDELGGPTYSWVDIISVGTAITGLGDDANAGSFPIGFNFDFYDNTFSSFRFCTNGWASFTATNTSYYNESLPTSDNPFNLLSPFWDDMTFSSSGTAYYYSNNTDSLVISWIDVPHYSSGGPYTFQIILQSNGNITYQYQTINSPDNSATIGIQNHDGSTALQVVYNAAYVHNNMAVRFKSPLGWLALDQDAGMIEPGANDTIGVLFDAADLQDGLYTGQLTVSSNDPVSPSINIPVTLTVGQQGDPIINLNISSIADTLEIGESADIDLIISNQGAANLIYGISDNASWITESPDTGVVALSASDTSVIILDASSLSEGSYSGNVTVTSNDDTNNPISIPVMLVVEEAEAPVIELNIAEIIDTVTEGGSTDIELIIGNLGNANLDYAISDDRSWISANPDSGIVVPLESDTAAVTLDASSLSAAIYTGTVTINSNDPVNGSIDLLVTLVVEELIGCEYMPGDINGDGSTIGSDVTYGVRYFRGTGMAPPDSCWDDLTSSWLYVAADANGDCMFIGSDLIYLVGYFGGINSEIFYCPRLPPIVPATVAAPVLIKDNDVIEEPVPLNSQDLKNSRE
ncbi:MAG: hypothetical protein J7K40_02985 [candidate division Zixibacteria bacterium]|nr:hypothetical protein [candidate division Zixibacteria bacterium]